MTEDRAASPVIVLCGFMGSGKTAVGERLARLLNVPFIDTDTRIAREQGRSIAEIFAHDGESAFRRIECELVATLSVDGGAVIATGGGMLVDQDNRQRLSRLGTLVHLDADFDVLADRVKGDASRPLASDPDALRALWETRRASYRHAALAIDGGVRSPDEAALDIAEWVASERRQTNLRVETRPLPWRPATPGNTRLCRVVTETGIAARLGEWLDRLDLRTSVYFLAPRHLQDLHLGGIVQGLEALGMPWQCLTLDDGDANKTLAQAASLLDELAARSARRDSVVVTLGGGVTGDLGGFVAAAYMRGIPWVNLPTTLLAQVDAAIGGKVGVNSDRAKNIAGSIYHPQLVLSDPRLLTTLPARELSGGMAEVIKTAMIGDARLFQRLLSSARDGAAIAGDEPLLTRVVADSAAVKCRVVETDPYERDLRRVLNLGHTLGHALETALGYERIRHGEGVALGLMAVLRVSSARGLANGRYLEDVREMLTWAGLPIVPPQVETSALRDALKLDKKRQSATLTCVLPIAPGRVEICTDVTEDELLNALAD